MKIRKLNDIDQPLLEQYLKRHIETSMFLLSNSRLAGLEFQNQPYQGEYFAAFSEGGELSGVLAHFWNGNILLQAPAPAILNQLADIFIKQITRPVAGILGGAIQVENLILRLNLAEADYLVNRDEGLYALPLTELRHPPVLHSSMCLPVDNDHRELLFQWLRSYNIEGLGAKDGETLEERVAQTIQRMLNNGGNWLLTVLGEPVSLSGFNARLPEIVQIGPVWTPPEHRNQGYARTLVANTLEIARNEGVQRAILFTDNPAATKAYEAIGFRRIGEYRLALLQNEVFL